MTDPHPAPGGASVDRSLARLDWHDDETFTLSGTRFTARTFGGFASTPDHFHLMKERSMVEGYVERLGGVAGGRIVELGIFRGGSTAFLAHLLRPEALVAVDIAAERVEALDAFVATHGYEASVRTSYGVDQSDAGLVDLVRRELGGAPPDLVIDDASHALDLTRRSFELLFPLLPPGGLYVIEDWAWGLYAFSPPRDEPSLSILVYELLLTLPFQPGVIASIDVDSSIAVVTRGDAPLDAQGFRVATGHNATARALVERLGDG
jgi:hypothetical protein